MSGRSPNSDNYAIFCIHLAYRRELRSHRLLGEQRGCFGKSCTQSVFKLRTLSASDERSSHSAILP